MWLPFQISDTQSMTVFRNIKTGIEYIILGMLLFTFIMSISIIIVIKAPTSTYSFFGTIIFAFLHQIVYGEKLILQWIPSISMESIVKLQYLVMYCMSIFALRTITFFCNKSLFSKRAVNIILLIFSIVSAAFAISVIFAPIYFTTSIIDIGRIYTYIIIGFCVFFIS